METLSPSIIEIRNSFLEKFKNEKLEMISKKLDQLFDVEKDPVKKLEVLTALILSGLVFREYEVNFNIGIKE